MSGCPYKKRLTDRIFAREIRRGRPSVLQEVPARLLVNKKSHARMPPWRRSAADPTACSSPFATHRTGCATNPNAAP